MIGLEPGLVRLESNHAEWAQEFLRLRTELTPEIDRLGTVEHVGSTAVFGLPAKPIVDAVVGCFALNDDTLRATIRLLEVRGYRYRGFLEEAGGHIADFLLAGAVTRHVHIVEHGSQQWRRYLLFRDALRKCAELRQDYGALKAKLAVQFQSNRRAYTSAKRAYIEQMTDQASAQAL